MTDFRQTKGGDEARRHTGDGRSKERDIENEFESHAGHPSGTGSSASAGGLSSDMPPNTDLTRDQHARKGQAQSPRELNLNQPEKKREGHH